MRLRRFCSKCGKNFEELDHIYDGFLCRDCFGAKSVEYEVPRKITLRICGFCRAFSLMRDDQEFGWEYQPKEEEDIDFLTRMLYVHIFESLEKKQNCNYELFFQHNASIINNTEILLHIQPKDETIIVIDPIDIKILVKEIHCPYCAKKSGGRFDAIVQIRIQHDHDKPRLDEIMEYVTLIEEQENFRNIENFISKIDTVINGFNLMVSTNIMARVLISKLRKKFHFEIKRSSKLIGINSEDSSDLYRLSTLLRLVPVSVKDSILLDGEKYIVKNITQNKVILQHTDTDKVKHVNYDIFQKKKWIFINNGDN